MAEQKHTLGEWYAFRHEYGGPPANGECYRIDIRGNPYRINGKIVGSEPICSLYAGFVHFEGNAAAILALPDLLAACRKAIIAFENEVPIGNPAIVQLKAALAKARGDSTPPGDSGATP